MGYGFIYLFCFLILVMLALKFFLPFLIYLIPVIVIVSIIKIIFKKRDHNETQEQTYYESTYQNQQNDNPDIIDVDYKVVDEEDNDTH